MAVKSRGAVSLVLTSMGALFVAIVVACVAFVQRDQLLVYHYVEKVVGRETPDSSARDWLRERPELCLPVLVQKLTDPGADPCRRAGDFLAEWCESHRDPTNLDDAHFSLSLAAMLNRTFPECSVPGKVQSARLAYSILETHLGRWSPNVPTALKSAGTLVLNALADPHVEVAQAALEPLEEAWGWSGADNVARSLVTEWRWKCYYRVLDSIDSDFVGTRLAAVRALRGCDLYNGDARLLALLKDPDPSVLAEALETISKIGQNRIDPAHRVILVDLLHHTDPIVRDRSHELLKASGFSDEKIRLLALMQHPDATERARAVEAMFTVSDVDQTVCLDRLVRDDSSVVRREVARSLHRVDGEFGEQLLRNLLASDPDEEVRRISQQSLDSMKK